MELRLSSESGCRKSNEDTFREVRFALKSTDHSLPFVALIKFHFPEYWTKQTGLLILLSCHWCQYPDRTHRNMKIMRLENNKVWGIRQTKTGLFPLCLSWKEDEWEWESRSKGTVTHSSAAGLLRHEPDPSELSYALRRSAPLVWKLGEATRSATRMNRALDLGSVLLLQIGGLPLFQE